MSSHADDPKRNLLLNAMPQDVYARLRPHLESVLLPLGASLYESGSTMAHMYFPVDCIVSLLYVMENGSCAEIAIVGFEGLVGISLFMGGGSTPNRAVVQSSGSAYRLRSNQVQSEFENNFPFRHLMLRYTQALLTQTAQTAVCNRHHSIEQQLCRWLLLSFDRLGSDQLVMTQELIANMLDVRRESVTEAAGVLQKKGLIHYARGHITLVDRGAMESSVCECYGVVKAEYQRLLPDLVSA